MPVPAPRHLPPHLRRPRGPALPVQARQAILLHADLPRRPRPAPTLARLPDLPRSGLEGLAGPDDARAPLRPWLDRQAPRALRQALPDLPRARVAQARAIAALGGPIPARRARDLRDRPALETGDGAAARAPTQPLHPACGGGHASGPKTAQSEEAAAARPDRGRGRAEASQRIARKGQPELRGAEGDNAWRAGGPRRDGWEVDLPLDP